MNNLDIYEKLREFHNEVKEILRQDMTSWKLNSIEALDSVLYLAEEVFSSNGKLTSDNNDYTTLMLNPLKWTADNHKRCIK